MHNNITGIILAGGKSIRMGEDKSLLKLGNKTVIEIIAGIMKNVFGNVVVVTNAPSKYCFLDLKTFSDLYQDKGPLGGIHSALFNSPTEDNFIVACDLPLINKELIEFILNYKSDKPVKVPLANGFVQQLCGCYSKKCLPYVEKIINEKEIENPTGQQRNKNLSVKKLLDIVGTEIINIENEFPGYSPDSFRNMNSPEDYNYISNKFIPAN